MKNIGWGYADRRADHASNGLEPGIDGWLYAAIGGPEARAAALASIEENWKQGPKRQAMMILAARETKAAAFARFGLTQ